MHSFFQTKVVQSRAIGVTSLVFLLLLQRVHSSTTASSMTLSTTRQQQQEDQRQYYSQQRDFEGDINSSSSSSNNFIQQSQTIPQQQTFSSNRGMLDMNAENINTSNDYHQTSSNPTFDNNDISTRTKRLQKEVVKKTDDDDDDGSSNSSGTTSDKTTPKCSVIEKCSYCDSNTYTDDDDSQDDDDNMVGNGRSGRKGCEETGRREKLECVVFADTSSSSSKKGQSGRGSFYEYRSCKRTESDEANSVFKLQIACLILAYVSIRSVKREKILSASLFDQRIYRRRGPAVGVGSTVNNNNNNNANYSEVSQIELSECSNNIGLNETSSDNKV